MEKTESIKGAKELSLLFDISKILEENNELKDVIDSVLKVAAENDVLRKKLKNKFAHSISSRLRQTYPASSLKKQPPRPPLRSTSLYRYSVKLSDCQIQTDCRRAEIP